MNHESITNQARYYKFNGSVSLYHKHCTTIGCYCLLCLVTSKKFLTANEPMN